MFWPKPLDTDLQAISQRLFSPSFLALPDNESTDPSLNFPSNYERFAAGELQKRADHTGFTKSGFLRQAIAAGWHFKSAEQIGEMGDSVGRERIAVVHGTGDGMIGFQHFQLLRAELGGEEGGATSKVWVGGGHVLVWEEETAVNEFLERRFENCERLGDEV